MSDTRLYKVAVTPCGKYVHGTEYDALCLVLNATEDGGDGCSYVSIKPNKNVRPGTDNTVWALSLERGEKGDQGIPGSGFTDVDVTIDSTSGTPSAVAYIENETFYLQLSGLKGADGKSAYELAVEEGYTGTEEEWLASLHGADGTDGTDGTDGKSAYEIAVDEGFVGTKEQWLASLKGEQGNTGSSVDYPYELVNNRTTDDATKGLSAAEGKRLGDDITQLDLKVGNPADAFQELPIQMTSGYFDVTGASVASSPTSSYRTSYCEIPCTPGEQFKVYGYGGTTARLWCFIDGSRNVLSVADDSVDARTTPAELTAPASSAILIYQATGYDLSKDKVETPLPVKVADTLDGTTETEWNSTAQSLTANKYYNTNSNPLPSSTSSATGIYCAKISVIPGEIYRITGIGYTTAQKLWAIGDADRARVRYASNNISRRDCPEILTIQTGEAFLYVNLYTYDSTTDKIEKLTSSSSHEKGLIERVADLENNPVTTPVVDALNSTSATDALSANQGRVLNEDINGVTTETQTDQEVIEGKYFNTGNSQIPTKSNLASLSGTSCVYLSVTPGEVYRIYGKGNSGAVQLYAMADSSRYVVQDGTPGVALNTRNNPLDLTIPEGVSYLVVNLYQYDSQTDKVQKIGHITSECVKTRLSALEQADTELASLALPLNGKKVMFFGDSITQFTYNGRGVVDYFALASLATCYKAAIGGTRLSQRATPVETPTTSTEAYAALDICNMVKSWCDADYTKQDAATSYLGDYSARVNALKNNPISGVDYVIIGGGTNDITAGVPLGTPNDSSLTTINGAVNQIVTMLLTANPALKIYFWSPVVGYFNNNRTSEYWSDNYVYGLGKTRPKMIDLIADMVKSWHLPFINLYWNLGWNELNFSQYFVDSDGTHPYKGFDVIGRRLYHQVVSLME